MSDQVTEYYTSPQGIKYQADRVLEVLTKLTSNERLQRIEAVLDARLTSLALGVEDLHHEHNGAACLRTAEGLGVHKVYAAEIRNPYPHPAIDGGPPPSEKKGRIPKGITMHAHRWVDLHIYKESNNDSAGVEMVRAAQSEGYRVFGAGPRGNFELLQLPLDQPIMVLFGNEAGGLRDDTMNACNGIFKIPMYGFTESFNISVSVGMVLEQLGAKIREKLSLEGIQGELSDTEKKYWKAKWLARDMRNIDVILKELIGH